MADSLQVYRRRIRSVQSTKKITKAMELIAASRISKAQQRVNAAKPYAEEVTRVVSAVATRTSTIDHPLVTERESPRRSAVLLVTSDRGLAGAYSADVLRRAEGVVSLLRQEGKEAQLYVVGRKGTGYYRFRRRPMAASWTGFSEQPGYLNAKEVSNAVIRAFVAGGDSTAEREDGGDLPGVDEIHIVFTQFINMITQRAIARRLLPLVVEESDQPPPGGPLPLYEFEPSSEALLDALLPRYVESRVFAALLEAAASESAARRRAMQSASDNADDLITQLTRESNSARQAAITQEISEIVGGADALATAD